jgi:hypothetical protein
MVGKEYVELFLYKYNMLLKNHEDMIRQALPGNYEISTAELRADKHNKTRRELFITMQTILGELPAELETILIIIESNDETEANKMRIIKHVIELKDKIIPHMLHLLVSKGVRASCKQLIYVVDKFDILKEYFLTDKKYERNP